MSVPLSVVPALLYSHPEHTFVFFIILLAATETVDNGKASSLCLFNSNLQPHYELHLILRGQKVALWLHECNQLKRKEKVTVSVNVRPTAAFFNQNHSLTFADTCCQIWLNLSDLCAHSSTPQVTVTALWCWPLKRGLLGLSILLQSLSFSFSLSSFSPCSLSVCCLFSLSPGLLVSIQG